MTVKECLHSIHVWHSRKGYYNNPYEMEARLLGDIIKADYCSKNTGSLRVLKLVTKFSLCLIILLLISCNHESMESEFFDWETFDYDKLYRLFIRGSYSKYFYSWKSDGFILR